MKRLFILLLITISLKVAYSQRENIFEMPIDSTTGLISFQEIIEEPSLSKAEIYSRSKQWIAGYYNSAKDVINMDDKETGLIKLKGMFSDKIPSDNYVFTEEMFYDLYIYIKEGKYKCVISALKSRIASTRTVDQPTSIEPAFFISSSDKDQMQYYQYRKDWGDRIKGKVGGIIESLQKAIRTKSDFNF